MKQLIIFVFVLFSVGALQGQAVEASKKRKNVVKVNALALTLVRTSTLSYERSLNDQMSVAVGFGRRFKGNLPSFVSSEQFGLTFDNTGLDGYVLHGDVRWYLRKCEQNQVMDGFYVGGYLKYNRFSYSADVTFENEGEVSNNFTDANLSDFGIGVALGYQLRLWERVVVDFLFLGPRSSRLGLDFEFEEPISQEFLDALSDNINDVLDRWGQDGLDLEAGDVDASATFNTFNLRYAISIGFAF